MPSKINLIVRLQNWMDSVPGQTFLNYAYSWGASIVILGALFKLTHIQGGNIMLFIGMGTEVVVFFLSAFDRPFDKNEVGKELPEDLETDEEIATRMGWDDEDETDKSEDEEERQEGRKTAFAADGTQAVSGGVATMPMGGIALQGGVSTEGALLASGVPAATGVVQGGGNPAVVIVGGNAGTTGPVADASVQSTPAVHSTTGAEKEAAAAIAANTPAGQEPFENEAQRLAQIIRVANDELLHRAQAVLSPEMEAATQTYIEKLQTLADTFAKVDEQSARLTKDSEEMENLNRTLTGINKVYELHLKSISLQVGTIDQINEQTHKLAQQIEELNAVYGRMIEALTVNMRGGNATSPRL